MIKKCHYDVILWGGFGSTKCDPNLTSHLHRFFAGYGAVGKGLCLRGYTSFNIEVIPIQ